MIISLSAPFNQVPEDKLRSHMEAVLSEMSKEELQNMTTKSVTARLSEPSFLAITITPA